MIDELQGKQDASEIESLPSKKRLSIAIIVHGFSQEEFGGIPVFIRNLSIELSKLGYRICILTKGDRGSIVIESLSPDIRVFHLPLRLKALRDRFPIISYFLFLFALISRGSRIVSKERISFVYGHGIFYGGFQSVFFGKLHHLPIILTIHGVDYNLNRWTAPLIKNADAFIVQRNAMITQMISLRFPEKLIFEIPNGVRLVEPIDLSERIVELRVLFVGRFDAFRAPILFVRAATIALQKGLKGEFIMVGDGPLFKETKDLIEHLGLSSRFRLTGMIDNPSVEYSKGHIFIACSPYENYSSLSLLEAMAWGLPIIATAVGETNRLVANGTNGLLCEPKPESIAEKMIQLGNNWSLIQLCGRNNMNLVKKEYGIVNMAKRYDRLFTKIVRENQNS